MNSFTQRCIVHIWCTVETLFPLLLETLFTGSQNPQIQVDMLMESRAEDHLWSRGTPSTDGSFVLPGPGPGLCLRELWLRCRLVFSDWTWQTRIALLILERLWSNTMNEAIKLKKTGDWLFRGMSSTSGTLVWPQSPMQGTTIWSYFCTQHLWLQSESCGHIWT